MPEQTFSIAENPRKIKKVAFLGGAAWKEGNQVYTDAYETARLLAHNGYEIVNGGGPGVMRASTMGGKMGGGKTLAVTYHPNKPKRHYEGVDPKNKTDEEIVTLDYFDRTKVMLQNTDLHIVFKGSLGTLSEFGMTWISSWIHEPDHKPIIMFGDFWNELLDVLQKHLTISNQERNMLKVCNSPQEVLEYTQGLENK
ncbi:MAG: LOG family protein [Patescibacteria group bacterium]